MSFFADLIIYDEVGVPYDGNTINETGLGGSEFQAILLAEECAKIGKKVICFNSRKTESFVNNVLYLSNNQFFDIKCKNLIVHRHSRIPKIPHKQAFVWSTDLFTSQYLHHLETLTRKKAKLIVLTEFHKNLFKFCDIDTKVVNFMIPDWVYDYKVPQNKTDYIYASAAMKGVYETIEFWKFLKNQKKIEGKLNICSPGYDQISKTIFDNDIHDLGHLPFTKLVEAMSQHKGMFYVNTMKETFCISAVLSEILNTNPYILELNGPGSLREVLKTDTITDSIGKFLSFFDKERNEPRNSGLSDYRISNVFQTWLSILRFD
jgi:hypothetical protein